MKIFVLLAALAVFAVAGCATRAKDVKPDALVVSTTAAGADKTKIPPRKEGEVPVFGKVALVELINRVYMPAKVVDADLYLEKAGMDTVYRVATADSGEFGVFLPAGEYRLVAAEINGYAFMPDLTLSVPAGKKAVYAGTLDFDGTPDGIEQGTKKTLFAYRVADEQKAFEQTVRQAAPDADVKFYKSRFRPGNGMIPGKYPTKVFRADDLERNLRARTDAVEEVVKGVIVALPYVINPLWVFTLAF